MYWCTTTFETWSREWLESSPTGHWELFQDKTLSTHTWNVQSTSMTWIFPLKDQVMVDKLWCPTLLRWFLHRIESKYPTKWRRFQHLCKTFIPGGIASQCGAWNSRIYPRRWRTWLCIVTRSWSCFGIIQMITTVIGMWRGNWSIDGWMVSQYLLEPSQRWCCSSTSTVEDPQLQQSPNVKWRRIGPLFEGLGWKPIQWQTVISTTMQRMLWFAEKLMEAPKKSRKFKQRAKICRTATNQYILSLIAFVFLKAGLPKLGKKLIEGDSSPPSSNPSRCSLHMSM